MAASLGDLEQVILLALVRLNGETHGAPIIQEIEKHTRRQVSPGALYTVLDRMETKEYVESWIGDSVPDRGGRRRKVYRLRPEGARVLRDWFRGIQGLSTDMAPRLKRLAEQSG